MVSNRNETIAGKVYTTKTIHFDKNMVQSALLDYVRKQYHGEMFDIQMSNVTAWDYTICWTERND